MAFENLFGTIKTETKPRTGNLFEGLFIKKEEPKVPQIRTVGLPEHLGGGRYKVGQPGELIKTPRSYAGMTTQEKQERDHIISVALGGTSESENLQYLKTTNEGRQEGKVSVEQGAINDYLDGKITLNQARLIVATKQQQIKGLTPTEREQTTKGQLGAGVGKLFGDIWGGFKKAVEFIKPEEEEIVDKERFDKLGVGITKFGDLAVRNPKTGNIIYTDTIGGVGRLKDVAKEGLDALGKYLLRSIKKTKLSVEVGQEVVETVSKQVKRLPEQVVKEPIKEVPKLTDDIAKAKAEGKSFEGWSKKPEFEYHLSKTPNLKEGETIAGQTTKRTGQTRGFVGGAENEIFTTKNPQFWHSQLAKEGENLNNVYLVEVKKPSPGGMLESGFDAQASNLPQDVRIIKKLGKVDKEFDAGYFEELKQSQLKQLWNKGDEVKVKPEVLQLEETFDQLSKRIDNTTNKTTIKTLEKQKEGISKQLFDIRDQAGKAELPKFMVTAAESIAPIKHQDDTVKGLFKNWTRSLLKSEQLANEYVKRIPKVSHNLDTILKYESGVKTNVSKEIKREFDKLYDVAKKNGIDIPYRRNYIPQVYDNTTEEIKEAMLRYMKDKGVDEQVINDYVSGIEELPKVISERLKLNPSFSKERAFPNYRTAIKYDLTPKYKQPAQLLANYKLELDKTIANKKFLESLAKKGEVVTVYKAKGDFQPINLPFSPKGYYAEPKLAKMLNGMFRNEEMLGLTETAFKFGATLSKTMQEIVLSAGIPRTNINFFTIGQLIKNLTAGEGKAAIAFIRSNFNSASIKYFRKNAEYLEKMANQGIDIVKNVSRYDDIYKKFGDVKGFNKKIGFTWRSFFEQKTFKSFIPQMQTQTFKNVYDNALKKMSAEEAEKLAGDTTKAFYGLFENVGRGKGTEDVISTTFFAPKFREGIIMTLYNTGKSITTEIFNPAFRKNRKLIAGMMLGYVGYNALNKELTGHYMWENPPGKEFDLMIPTEEGVEGDDVVYVPFMPSFLAFARNLVSGFIATAKGDISTAKQKFGSVFSMPVKLAAEVWANKDYFGREIYDANADKKTQLKQIAGYVFGFGKKGASGGINHPFVRELYNQIATDKPLYQSVSEAMEMPLKFSTMSSIEQQAFYEALRKKEAEEKRERAEFKPRYDEVKELLEAGDVEGATRLTEAMTEEEYKLYKSHKRSDKARANIDLEIKVFERYNQIQELMANGQIAEATNITESMTPEEYKAYKRLKNKLQ